MASRDDMTLPAARPKSRKSLAHVPSANAMNKENMTADIGAMAERNKRAALGERPAKKSRSKSIGPGGLDALKDTSGNRRKSIAAPPPKSILKPTMPPLQEIPARKPSPRKANQLATTQELKQSNLMKDNNDDTADPFSLPDSSAVANTRVMLRTEEEQQAAARERAAKEYQDKETEVNARRDARRKSLANRRVSFAPEATLHTWDVVEYMQDSTTSSASTNSTRRASSASNGTIGSPHTQTSQFSSDPTEPPSTPPEQVEDIVRESPADQRSLHQKKRRRSSGIPPLNFNNPDDEFFSSSPSDGSSVVDEANENFDDEDASDSNNDSDDDDGTAMSIDAGDATDMSMASMKSFSSDGSSVRLEKALQLAAQQAGTQGIEFDEHGPLGIEEEEEEIVASFAPWSKKASIPNLESLKDQENLNPFSPSFKAASRRQSMAEEDDGMTMEMTRSVGGILQAPEPEQSDDDITMEMTMDMTKAMGRIIPTEHADDDGTMEMTRAVGRILPPQQRNSPQQSDDEMTMDMTRAAGRILPSQQHNSPQQSDEEMTMDMTMAIGGIIQQEAQAKNRRKSVQPSRRQSLRRRSSADTSSLADETMEFTMAIGGIQQPEEARSGSADDEDMTMEFTSIIGGVLAPGNPSRKRQSIIRRRESTASEMSEVGMDMTMAVGSIIAAPIKPSTPKTAPLYPDLKTALDEILPHPPSATSRPEAKRVLEQEVAHAELDSSPFQAEILPHPPSATSRPEAKRILEQEVDHAELDSSPFQADIPAATQRAPPIDTIASETGSPSMNAFRGKGLRMSIGLRASTTPKATPVAPTSVSTPSVLSPLMKAATPSKQLTPQPIRPTTPGKTPPSKDVSMRTGSPQRLFAKEIKAAKSTPKSTSNKKLATPNKLFQKDRDTGAATPSIVLKPQRRRSSGVGIDKAGLGSPRLAAILDRRRSIGELASSFQPSPIGNAARVIRFDDVEAIEQEVDKEREEEKLREDGRKIMEREADQAEGETDATVNLKEMIESLTPKKRPLKGRKSLHVGAAKGLLGKRPIELDEDEDDDEGGTKRLKNFQGSPVKKVKLNPPPSKEETTGRITRATRRSLEAASGNAITPTAAPSPVKDAIITTPRGQGRFKDAEALPGAEKAILFEAIPTQNVPIVMEGDKAQDRMQLQDFLNLTSIRFMELTTTKRRHTVAPGSLGKNVSDKENGKNDGSLESCVVAGACTLPMLELFQHSCHELKKYISEGRKVVRVIETETFDENPPLFQEYISATGDLKTVMDNQFKNMKTHSRLVSRGMWYEWRMKLLDGLRAGLIKIAEGMASDSEILAHQQELLNSMLPSLQQQYEALFQEEAELQTAAEAIANCNQEDLAEARECLVALDADIDTKKAMIQELRNQIEDNENTFKVGTERKQACLDDIREAEKIREECRGWTGTEIAALKAKVDALEEKYGWTVTGVSGTTISLSLRGDLELVFDASSFKTKGKELGASAGGNSRIDLWYIAANRERNPLPLTPEKAFFVDSIRDGIRAMPQSETTVKQLLDAISSGWETSLATVEDIKALTRGYPTEVAKTSDVSIVVRSMTLLVPLKSKVEISYHVSTGNGEGGLEVEVKPEAKVVYGERFNEDSMTRFLGKGVSDGRSWMDVVKELDGRLLARGRK